MDIRSLGNGVQTGTTAAQPVPVPASQSSSANPAPTQQSGTAAVSQPSQTAAVQPEPSVGQVQKAVDKINNNLASQTPGIEFSIDSTSHRIVVKVVDQSNNQVIRQIPSKEALAIADSIDESQSGQGSQGLLIKQQA